MTTDSAPVSPPITCPAFSRPFKLLALALVAGLGSWMYELWQAGKLASNNQISPSNGLIWLLCGFAMMAYTLVAIYTSKTTLTSTHIRQTWIWNKEVAIAELAYAKLIRIRGLDWLIAPRLYVRTTLGKFHVFYAADVSVIHRFKNLIISIQHRDF